MKTKTLYVLSILPFIFFVLGYIASHLFLGPSINPAPNLIGMTIHEALKETSKYHVTLQLITEKECTGVTPGTILTQKPAAGRLIKPHQTILITASKQPSTVLAPSVIEKNSVNIQETGKKMGIKIKEYPILYHLPQGQCISQYPQADTALTDKKMIAYTAQAEPNIYIMPNFLQKELSQVANTLKHHNIKYSCTNKAATSQSPIIVAQKPRPGTFVTLSEKLAIQFEVN